MTTRFKMGLVGFLACLTLMLGLFSTTGIASAHTTSALQSQVSTSAAAKDDHDRRCQTFVIVRNRFSRFEDHDFFMFGQFFHRRFERRFETIIIVTICHGHRFERFETRGI